MDLHLFFFGPSGAPTEPHQVTVTLRLPDRALGPLSVTLQGFGGGHETATIAVPVPGNWTLTVSARTTAFDVYAQDVTLPIQLARPPRTAPKAVGTRPLAVSSPWVEAVLKHGPTAYSR